jgi:hypothetical protein
MLALCGFAIDPDYRLKEPRSRYVKLLGVLFAAMIVESCCVVGEKWFDSGVDLLHSPSRSCLELKPKPQFQ